MAIPLTDRPSLPQDEAELVRRIRARDTAAFEQVMRRYNRRLYRLARAVLKNDQEAEDALQDAYLHAWQSMDQFRGEAALSTWLSRLVLNESFGRVRRTARRHNVIPMVSSNTDVDMSNIAANDANRPEEVFGRTQIRAVLERKLDDLPESFRLVFILRSVEEMSVEETAQTLGIPEATVRTRHFRAKSQLREALAQEVDLAERDLFEFGGAQCDHVVARVLARLASTVDAP